MKLREVGEDELLAQLLPALSRNRSVMLGAGDDCAADRDCAGGDLAADAAQVAAVGDVWGGRAGGRAGGGGGAARLIVRPLVGGVISERGDCREKHWGESAHATTSSPLF